MAGHDIIVVGASAGGLQALRDLVRALDPSLSAAMFVVRHFPATGESLLPDILQRDTELDVQHAEGGQSIRPGCIYVAPTGYHLTLTRDQSRLTFGPRINGARPAIDPLFFSAARNFGPRVAGVLLSGHLDDGVAGLLAIHRGGGFTLVQSPEEAEVPDMPQNALRYFTPDEVLPAEKIGQLLSTQAAASPFRVGDVTMSTPARSPEEFEPAEKLSPDAPSAANDEIAFSCPECGGAMRRVDAPGPPQFRCHIGHVLTGESLLAQQYETLERSIWYASRTLKEIVVLARELADRASQESRHHSAATFEGQARSAERHLARLQRDLLEQPLAPVAETENDWQ